MRKKTYHHDPGDDPSVTVIMQRITAADWKRLAHALVRRSELPRTYSAWQAAQSDWRRTQLEKGYRIIDMPVKASAVLAWCAAMKTPLTMRAIVRYVLQRHAGKA